MLSIEEFIVSLNKAGKLYADGKVHPIDPMSKTALRCPEDAAVMIALEKRHGIRAADEERQAA